jgi:hypothetical protein
MTDLAFARKFPDVCCEGVTRHGEFQPCDRVAVAVRVDLENGGSGYPVCAYHARGDMVPLTELLAGDLS